MLHRIAALILKYFDIVDIPEIFPNVIYINYF